MSGATLKLSRLFNKAKSETTATKDENNWSRVTSVFTTLVTDLDADQLSDYLIEGQIISVEQWHEITTRQFTKQGKCRELLSLLIRMKNPRAYEVFMDALKRNTQWHWIADKINGQEIQTFTKEELEDLRKENKLLSRRVSESEERLKEVSEKLKLLTREKTHLLTENEKLTLIASESEKGSFNELKRLKEENECLSAKVSDFKEHRQKELERLKVENERLFSQVSEYEKLLYRHEERIKYKDKARLIHTTPVQENKAAILGIAVLFDDLFATFLNSSFIAVYDTKTLRQSSNPLHVEGLCGPGDIASCSTHKCLYVIGFLRDTMECHLLKIDPERSQPMQRWKHIDWNEARLSVYKTNVIVCLAVKRVIVKYSASGETLQTIRLSAGEGFDQMLYAIQVTTSNFVVSYKSNDSTKRSVCLIDCHGKIITSADEERLAMGIPACLVKDNDKSVLVILNYHDWIKIVLLNHKLQYQRVLIEYSTAEIGFTLCLDSTGSNLFVLVNSSQSNFLHSGQILVYNIK